MALEWATWWLTITDYALVPKALDLGEGEEHFDHEDLMLARVSVAVAAEDLVFTVSVDLDSTNMVVAIGRTRMEGIVRVDADVRILMGDMGGDEDVLLLHPARPVHQAQVPRIQTHLWDLSPNTTI
jgi:hypothetical protein